MAAPPTTEPQPLPSGEPTAEHTPYVPASKTIPEFTLVPVLVGAILGVIFGASSLYLLFKAGMTVSASVPIAVLSITLFRVFSRAFGFRNATILENNIVQTAGSAGESIAFGVGVTMPALLLLGFEMTWTRVLVVAVLGGLLGILMMIPLRRAFIVKQHGKLKYPEGTACAEVLVAGEKGGTTAKMVFVGFGIAFLYKILSAAFKLWPADSDSNETNVAGLKGAAVSGDLTPEMMGVGFLIGPRIACLMMAGAVLSFLVIGPLIANFGANANAPIAPAKSNIEKEKVDGKTVEVNKGLIPNMTPGALYTNYLRYIGAGAVAAGGIIGMLRALPLILASIAAGLRDLRSAAAGGPGAVRTERDLSIRLVFIGCIALVIALTVVPQLGLGLSVEGILGAILILILGFLFVTVSSRLTGEVGSSSNPISGMTIAALLITCLAFVLIGKTAKGGNDNVLLTAISVAAVVCIASSNGGTTSQDLKTGFLVGATPKYQQYAILIGTLLSAVVIGGTLMFLNSGWSHYTTRGFPPNTLIKFRADAPAQRVGQPHQDDETIYRLVYLRHDLPKDVNPGWYLAQPQGPADSQGYMEGILKYRQDVPIQRDYKTMDNDQPAPPPFSAPQPKLFQLITEGILGGQLEWGLIITGVLIAITIELMGVSSLPVAVGMYLGMGVATPVFIGGLIRWLSDRWRGASASEAEAETSPGVLLSSGYIAGGTLCGLLIGFAVIFFNTERMESINLAKQIQDYADSGTAKIVALAAFGVIGAILLWIGSRKQEVVEGGPSPSDMPRLDDEFPHHMTGDERPPD